METYKISQIAKLLGLSSDTIRFYEKKGLVHPSVNPDNQYREYSGAAGYHILPASGYILTGYSVHLHQQKQGKYV